jgi:hypothetical protein
LVLTEEQRRRVTARLRTEVWQSTYHHEVFEAVHALCYVTGEADTDTVLDSFHEHLARYVPLDPAGLDTGLPSRVRALSWAHPPPRHLLDDPEERVDLVPAIGLMDYLRELYERRARQLQGEGQQPDPQLPPAHEPVPDSELGIIPLYRQLQVFRMPLATPWQVYGDVLYLRALHQARQPVEVVGRNWAAMRQAGPQLVQFALGCTDATQRAVTLRAMEYLFEVRHEAGLSEFYIDFGNELARQLPSSVERWTPELAGPYIRLAGTISELMPNPPTGTDGQPLPQPARTAAVMASICRFKALQLIAKERARVRQEIASR